VILANQLLEAFNAQNVARHKYKVTIAFLIYMLSKWIIKHAYHLQLNIETSAVAVNHWKSSVVKVRGFGGLSPPAPI